MAETFEVTQGGQTVGWVEVRREGLYCRLSCRCKRSDDAIHRLYAGGEKIAVLIPEGEELVLETRVAAKRLKEGRSFSLDGKRENFIPIRPGEAFNQLDKVRHGKLTNKNGVHVLEYTVEEDLDPP